MDGMQRPKVLRCKYLKNRTLPIFSEKKYNEGFEQGYKHAIQLIKKSVLQK